MIRRFGATPEKGRRYTLRPGAYAILERSGALLVTHQAAPTPEFQLPGGGIEAGESPLTALHREVFEETGWRIGRAQVLGQFRRFTFMPEYDLWAEKLCIVFKAYPVRKLSDPIEPEHEAVWMAPRLASEKLGNPGDRHFVARHFR